MAEPIKKGILLPNPTVELEMLVSAAVVFGASQMGEWVQSLIRWALNHNVPGENPIMVILSVSGIYFSTILPISIVTHFLLRVYWLSLVSLQNAFANVPSKPMKLGERYQRLLRKGASIEQQIRWVDAVSSSIFAFSFLSLFSFTLSFVIIFMVSQLLDSIALIGPSNFWDGLSDFLSALLYIGGIIYAIDFFTIGGIKNIRQPIFQRLYWPIYRFYGWITLAIFYRSIYYRLVEYVNRPFLRVALIGYFTLALFFLNQGYDASVISPQGYSSDHIAYGTDLKFSAFYADILNEESVIVYPFIDTYRIPSEVGSTELSIPILAETEDYLIANCPGVVAFTQRGINWRRSITVNLFGISNRVKYPEGFNKEENLHRLLGCFAEYLDVRLDDRQLPISNCYLDLHRPTGRRLISTMIPLDSLERGHHLLSIQAPSVDSTILFEVPFFVD